MPRSPKPATGLPVRESRAMSRASIVATKMRRSPPRCHVATRLRVESPALLAGNRIEGDDASYGRAEIERSVDIERRRFERGPTPCFGLVCITGAKRPGDLERSDVLAIDAIERGESLPAWIS